MKIRRFSRLFFQCVDLVVTSVQVKMDKRWEFRWVGKAQIRECTLNMLENGSGQAAGLAWWNAPADCFSSSLKMDGFILPQRWPWSAVAWLKAGVNNRLQSTGWPITIAEDRSRFDCEQEEESKDLSLALMFPGFLCSLVLFQHYHNNGWMGIVALPLSQVALTFPFLHPSVTCGKRELPACCRKQKGGCF